MTRINYTYRWYINLSPLSYSYGDPQITHPRANGFFPWMSKRKINPQMSKIKLSFPPLILFLSPLKSYASSTFLNSVKRLSIQSANQTKNWNFPLYFFFSCNTTPTTTWSTHFSSVYLIIFLPFTIFQFNCVSSSL